MVKKLSSSRIGLITSVLLIVTFSAGIALESLRTRKNAELLLGRVRDFKVGLSTMPEIDPQLKSFAAFKKRNIGECTNEKCKMLFHFSNEALSRLHLAPPTAFDVLLEMQNGVLVGVESYLGQNLCCVAHVFESTEEWKGMQDAIFQRDSTGALRKVIFHIGPRTSSSERSLAYSFNLSCLTRVRGCARAEDLLPAVESHNFTAVSALSEFSE